jgi:hypothetical protein
MITFSFISFSIETAHALVILLNLLSAALVYLTMPSQQWLKQSLAVVPAYIISMLIAAIAICIWQPMLGLVPAIFASLFCWILSAFSLPYLSFLVSQWRTQND